jgi:hypothetical protein
MTRTALDTPDLPPTPISLCSCCGESGRRLTELHLAPNTFICRRCAWWSFWRASRPFTRRCA